jgi:hypothetical protein
METYSKCKQKDITIIPNPFDNYTIISIHEEITQPYTLQIFDINGTRILQHSNILSNKFILGRKSLKAGTYFYKLYSGDYRYFFTGKLYII